MNDQRLTAQCRDNGVGIERVQGPTTRVPYLRRRERGPDSIKRAGEAETVEGAGCVRPHPKAGTDRGKIARPLQDRHMVVVTSQRRCCGQPCNSGADNDDSHTSALLARQPAPSRTPPGRTREVRQLTMKRHINDGRWDDLGVRLTAGRDIGAALARYGAANLTYAPVGATRGHLPPGYRHTERRVRIGAGAEAFGRAADAVLTWEMHRRSGLTVAAEGPAVEGRTVVLGLGKGLKLLIPCRLVYVVD